MKTLRVLIGEDFPQIEVKRPAGEGDLVGEDFEAVREAVLEVCDAFDGVQFYRDDDPVLDFENVGADDHAAICGELVRRLVDRGYAQ